MSSLAATLCVAWTLPATADDKSVDAQLKAIRAELRAQEKRLEQEDRLLKAQEAGNATQSAVIDSQREEILRLNGRTSNGHQPIDLAEPAVPRLVTQQPPAAPRNAPSNAPATATAASSPPAPSGPPASSSASAQPSNGAPAGPVGEAPKEDEQPAQVVQSLPEGLAVLTPRNGFVVTPSQEYTHTSNDRLVYRGVVIVPGINLGEVDASSDERNIFSDVIDVRYGLLSRLEIEARVPLVWSDDRATVVSQGPQGSATQSIYLRDSGIGDIEVGARYQINGGMDDWPIFLASARVKTDTGLGPFDIKRDSAGIAQQVALGSGFMGLEGGFSILKLTDPAVLFGSMNYVYNIPKDINQNIGTVHVGEVYPSNSISATMGFGFAVNPEFSFSMGYEHSYVMSQYTQLGTTEQQTPSLQVGAMTFGMAYRLSPTVSLNANFEFGVTAAAPDMRAVFSVPVSF